METALCQRSGRNATWKLLRCRKIVQLWINIVKSTLILPRSVHQLSDVKLEIRKTVFLGFDSDADEVRAHKQLADRKQRA